MTDTEKRIAKVRGSVDDLRRAGCHLLADEFEFLLTALSDARADGERLDWIIGEGDGLGMRDRLLRWHDIYAHSGVSTHRKAIDAARSPTTHPVERGK